MSSSPAKSAIQDFVCEHQDHLSRLLVVTSLPDTPPTAQHVLSLDEAGQAEHAAELLRAAIHGPGPALDVRLATVAAALPAAEAEALRAAFRQALQGWWPSRSHSLSGTSPRPHVQEPADDDQKGPEEGVLAGDQRLADLPGRVVRVIHLKEFHITDPDAVLAEADNDGWEPLPADELPDDDPRDLTGALMHLATTGVFVPGTDELADNAIGSMLDPVAGDEVADWSTTPVTADFGTGYRAGTADPGLEPAPAAGKLPDYADLFPLTSASDDEEDEHWQLTPRTAAILHSALSVLADQAYDDADELGDGVVRTGEDGTWGVFGRLPRLTWKQDHQWRRAFARACDDLSNDLEAGQQPEPTCPAEEMALHLALADAPSTRELLEDLPKHQALPHHADDYDWDACTDLLFQDTDILMLFSPRLDGIEDPDDTANQAMGIGDMRPAAWFKPFDNVEARDPKRGFRR
ncbi:hypothetical protein ACFQ6N_19145 [Kitasatospora sp. NPDC056446]|uniref:hypothetical protein n=1 Tax=Kitasatospora sp. NPDC056446 TaxID=3345819 RepID=UPI00367C5FC5